jgi:hypothetical protein
MASPKNTGASEKQNAMKTAGDSIEAASLSSTISRVNLERVFLTSD